MFLGDLGFLVEYFLVELVEGCLVVGCHGLECFVQFFDFLLFLLLQSLYVIFQVLFLLEVFRVQLLVEFHFVLRKESRSLVLVFEHF